MVDPRRDIANAATVGGFRLAALAARGLPGFAAQGISPALGFGASFANAERRAMIERHLRRADPTMGGARLRRAVQLAFDSYTRYWLESFRLPHLPRRTVDRGMRVDGYEHVETALAGGKGLILALPHLGGWEWAGRWLADRGLGVTAVVEAIEPPELFEWFKELRNELGMNIVALGPDAGKEVLAALQRNDVVCLLSDRDIQRTGIDAGGFCPVRFSIQTIERVQKDLEHPRFEVGALLELAEVSPCRHHRFLEHVASLVLLPDIAQ